MNDSKNKRLFRTIGLLVILAIAMSNWIENTLVWNYQEDSIASAFTIYGIARALNGAISMLQGTEIEAVVFSVSIGEALDPINDLIERFSWIVMMAIASLGIQKVMLSVVVSKAANLLLASIIAGYVATLWFRPLSQYRSGIFKAVCILLFIRFSLTMVFLCNYALDSYYFSDQKDSATAVLVESKNIVENQSLMHVESTATGSNNQSNSTGESLPNSPESDSDGSVLGWSKKMYSEAEEYLSSVTDKVTNIPDIPNITDITNSMENSISSLLDLIVFYILQTVLLPIGFIFTFYKALRFMLRMGFNIT